MRLTRTLHLLTTQWEPKADCTHICQNAALDLLKGQECLLFIKGLEIIFIHIQLFKKGVSIDSSMLRLLCFQGLKVHANIPQFQRQVLWVSVWGLEAFTEGLLLDHRLVLDLGRRRFHQQHRNASRIRSIRTFPQWFVSIYNKNDNYCVDAGNRSVSGSCWTRGRGSFSQ